MKGKLTTVQKQQQILVLSQAGNGAIQISKKIKIPLSTIKDVIRRGQLREKRRLSSKLGRKTTLTPRDLRAITREVKKSPTTTASSLKKSLKLTPTVRTIRNALKRQGYKRKKLLNKPSVTSKQKKMRLEFAEKHVTWTDGWTDVIFTDEKKWNLDGPDGYRYYWQGLNSSTDKIYFSKDPYGKHSVMVFGAISARGKLELLRVRGKINSRTYCQMIANNIYPDAHTLYGEAFILQHDRASCHVSKETTNFLDDWSVDVLEWPSKSPDLNPIENLWGILTRMVFHDGAVYRDEEHLWNAIKSCWDNISMETVQSLISSMNMRMIKVLEKNGGITKY